MSNPERIEINGATYLLEWSGAGPGPLKLLVLQRGFIYVGEWDEDECFLRNASNVRKWESGGFGGLTLGARSSGAVLDECTDFSPNYDAVLSVHDLPEGWLDA